MTENKKISGSQLKNFIKESLLDLMLDDDFKSCLVEIIQDNSEEILGFKGPQRIPENADLWDDVVLAARGKIDSVEHNGILIESANGGQGYTSNKNIQKWAKSMYSRLGGRWIVEKPSGLNERYAAQQYQEGGSGSEESINALRELGGLLSGNDGSSSVAAPIDESVLEQNLGGGMGRFKSLEDGSEIDLSNVLRQTAKTTYKQYAQNYKNPAAAPAYNDQASRLTAHSTPKEIFGSDAINRWGAAAFGKGNRKRK